MHLTSIKDQAIENVANADTTVSNHCLKPSLYIYKEQFANIFSSRTLRYQNMFEMHDDVLKVAA